MLDWICPVCGKSLMQAGGSLRCESGHCFDVAKQGYVNLLLNNQPGYKRHGDDKRMVRARRAFLSKGYYQPVLDGVLDLLRSRLTPGGLIVDAGCGEGWYTRGAADLAAELDCRVCGVDISRDAVAMAAKSGGGAYAVASAARLPLAEDSCRAVLNLFSPLEAGEYGRVLVPGGWLLRAIPLPRHLFSLKAAIYDKPYENDLPDPTLPGFCLVETLDIRDTLHLEDPEDIRSLFAMTPYYYKTGAADQAKLDALDRLDTELEVRLLCYRK